MCIFLVALASDIWSGRAREDYLSVVAHYVNDDRVTEKRIICFKLIADNIADCIIRVVEDFGLTNKIFSITLDNAVANSKVMDILTPVFSTYVDSFLLHQRCACHIINLIVKSYLKMYENGLVLHEAIVAMKTKYLKYYREIPFLYAFAFILDPRGKIEAFANVLDLLSNVTKLDYYNYFAEVRYRLHEIYQRYENKFWGVRLQRPPVSTTSSSKINMWDMIFGGSFSKSRSSSSIASPAQPRTTPRNEELFTYLDSDTVDFN